MNEWSLTFSGIAPWLFFILAALTFAFFWIIKASALRILAALIILVFLLEPSITYKSRIVIKPKAILLIDDSKSMEIRGLNSSAIDVATALETGLKDQISITQKNLGTTDSTDFSSSLEQLSNVKDLNAVILISDGQQTESKDTSRIAMALRAQNIIIHGVLLGSPETPVDAVINDISGPESVSISNQVVIKVRYRLNLNDTNAWNLVLRRGDIEVATKNVFPSKSWQEQALELTLDEAGSFYLTALLQPIIKVPEITALNNSADYLIQVKNDSLRILLLDATPRWEARYIASLFERDNNNTLVRKYLSVHSSEDFFPESLDHFDVIFLGDFRESELPRSMQDKLENYVNSRGGFLVSQAGRRAEENTPLRNLLPVRLGPSSKAVQSPVQALPVADEDTGLAFATPEFWKALAPLRWHLQRAELKPGALALLSTTHGSPLAAVQHYGAGRVLWVGTDETWRWRESIGGDFHDKFWLQLAAWGARTKFRGKDERLQIALGKNVINPQEAAELLIRAEEGETLELTATNENRHVKNFNVERTGDFYRVNLKNLQTGNWSLLLTNTSNGLGEQTNLIVRASQSRELIELSSNPQDLGELVKAGGGTMVSPEQLPALMSELKSSLKPFQKEQTKTLSLWDNYIAIIIFTALLSADWLLRKRRGLD